MYVYIYNGVTKAYPSSRSFARSNDSSALGFLIGSLYIAYTMATLFHNSSFLLLYIDDDTVVDRKRIM